MNKFMRVDCKKGGIVHNAFKIATLSLFVLFTTSSLTFSMPAAGTVDICFTPDEDCTGQIVREINAARQEVLLQGYSFTSAPIAKALVAAHRRGVTVEAILDKSQRTERYTSATFLKNSGIPVLIDSQHPIAHNKILCIDRETVETGSFNYSKAAQHNAENVLIFHNNPALVQRYLENYFEHRQHSEAY